MQNTDAFQTLTHGPLMALESLSRDLSLNDRIERACNDLEHCVIL